MRKFSLRWWHVPTYVQDRYRRATWEQDARDRQRQAYMHLLADLSYGPAVGLNYMHTLARGLEEQMHAGVNADRWPSLPKSVLQ